MNKKRITFILMIQGVLGLVAVFVLKDQTFGYDQIVTWPFKPIADGLRWLSLRGEIENIFAWIIYIGICLIPIIYLIVRWIKKVARRGDVLLVIVSILMFINIYYAINPGLAAGVLSPEGLTESGIFAVSSVIYTVLLSYVVFRLLGRYQASGTQSLIGSLKVLLTMMASFTVIVLTIVIPGSIMKEIQVVMEANTGYYQGFGLNNAFIIIRELNRIVPIGYELVILSVVYDFMNAFAEDPYCSETIAIAEKLEMTCKNAIIWTLLVSVGTNVLQLFFNARILASHYDINISFTSLFFLLVVMLLGKHFRDTAVIKEENDLFV